MLLVDVAAAAAAVVVVRECDEGREHLIEALAVARAVGEAPAAQHRLDGALRLGRLQSRGLAACARRLPARAPRSARASPAPGRRVAAASHASRVGPSMREGSVVPSSSTRQSRARSRGGVRQPARTNTAASLPAAPARARAEGRRSRRRRHR